MRRGSSSGLLTVLGWLRVGLERASEPGWAGPGLFAMDSGAPDAGACPGVCMATNMDSSTVLPTTELLMSLIFLRLCHAHTYRPF